MQCNVCIGDLRMWIPECDIGMGPFLVIEIGKWNQEGEKTQTILDDIVTVMYGDGTTQDHILEGMEEDTVIVG